MRTAAIAKLKAGLSGYIESVKAGEQVVVTRPRKTGGAYCAY